MIDHSARRLAAFIARQLGHPEIAERILGPAELKVVEGRPSGGQWEARYGGWKEAHVMPLGDLRPHDETPDCWCKPFWEDGICVHNSLDKREFYERGDLKSN